MTETQIKDFYGEMTQFYTEIEVDGVTVLVPFIRQSERRSFKACQFQWNWSWNQGFTPALPKSDARWFGTGLHLALAEWYIPGVKRGRNPHETWDQFTGDNYTKIATGPYFDPDEWVDAKALGHEMIDNYLKEYGQDSDWEVIAVEQRYRMKIRDHAGKVIGVLVGTFDAVFRNRKTNEIWMMDHKTERDRINTNHLVKDEQAGTYVAVATKVLRAQGKIGPNEVVRGIIYNFLRKAKADVRPRNSRGVYCNKPTKPNYVAQISRYLSNLWTNPQTTEATKDKLQKQFGLPAAENEWPALAKLKLDELAAVAEGLKLEVFGDESKQQPAPLFARDYVIRNEFERNRQIDRIRDELIQMAAVRGGLIPLTKAPGDHCGWCDFKDLCDVNEQGGDEENYAKAAFRQRDPYADHRPNAANSKTSALADKARKREDRAF